MTCRYARDASMPCDQDVFTRTFNVAAGSIELQYHFGAGRAARSWRIFSADGVPEVVQVCALCTQDTALA